MKTGAAILLLIAFAAQTFSKAFLVVDYYARTDVYAANCENKDKPVLKCHGKCQMAKKIQQEEKKDEQNPERKVENKVEWLSSRSFFTALPLQILPVTEKKGISAVTITLSTFPRDIFHPPIA